MFYLSSRLRYPAFLFLGWVGVCVFVFWTTFVILIRVWRLGTILSLIIIT